MERVHQTPPYSIDGQLCDETGQPIEELPDTARNAATVTESQLCKLIQLDVLGELENCKIKVFSDYHRKARVIDRISYLSYEDLLQLAGPPVKEHVQEPGGEDDSNDDSLFPLNDYKRAIAMMAGYRLIGDDTELGVGCWEGKTSAGEKHPSVVVVGAGEGAEWNGEQKFNKITHPRCRGNLLDFECSSNAWYDYRLLKRYLEECDQDFAIDVRDRLLELFGRWRWRFSESPLTITGLVLATWVQSLWEWRPQIALIGASKSGKTMMCMALEGLFGSLCCKSSQSTAAGIRQAIKNSSRVVLCDEFEHSRQRQEILDMLRASGRGDAVLRGTTHQKGMQFTLRHIVWVAAIEVNLKHAPDRNRFITLELLNPEPEQKGKLTMPLPSELADLGHRALAVAIRYIHAAKPLAARLKDTRVPGVDDRVIESYAVPAAMLAVLDGLGEPEARELMSSMMASVEREAELNMADESAMMEGLICAHVRIGRDDITVGQALEKIETAASHESEATHRALESYGVKIDRFHGGPRGGDRCLVVSSRMVPQHLFKNTDWEGKSVSQILKRIHPDTVLGRRRIGGVRSQCVQIPFDFVEREFCSSHEDGSLFDTQDGGGSDEESF